jgi:hypothetical protein
MIVKGFRLYGLDVADSCAAISRPMRLFARTLAQAQAAAIIRNESRRRL